MKKQKKWIDQNIIKEKSETETSEPFVVKILLQLTYLKIILALG